MFEKRSIGLYVVLVIVTGGIFGLYWFYKIADDLYRMSGEESKAGTDLLLGIVTCGIYMLYCYYQYGRKMAMLREKFRLSPKDEAVMYLILALFGFSIINLAIMQSALNDELVGAANGNAGPGPGQFYN